MQIEIPESELEFAREVDRLGALGKTQAQIAAAFDLTKDQVRHRLMRAHLVWAAESRVRSEISNARLEDALASGEFTPAHDEEPAVPVTA